MEEKPKRSKIPAKRAPAKSAAKGATPQSAKTAAKSKPASAPSSAASHGASSRTRPKIPAILKEGDRSPVATPSGPGERYAIGAAPRSGGEMGAELPEAYGTGRLLLTARDPHWLYTHWDLTNEQLKELNAKSRDGHLVVRIFRNEVSNRPAVEQHVHPESRNWFVHVPSAGARYVAQLGYYGRSGTWTNVSTSSPTFTPPDALSSDTSVRFETIPVEIPFKKLLDLVKTAVSEHVPLVEALEQLRNEGFNNLPKPEHVASATWTPAQEEALARVVNIDSVRRVWMGSLEITELIRRKLEHEISSQAIAALARGEQVGAGELGGLFSVSSPFGGAAEKERGFWFNVNAELIVYGSTDPAATVTIGGHKIQLRRDGSFSFRFALPDGQYNLPIAAASPDKVETRRAQLGFRRETVYHGDVGAHPQDRALKTPGAENVA
jgi:uncharacterized protein